MEFYAIMGIGTVVAILVVIVLPKSGSRRWEDDLIEPPTEQTETPAWKKDISEAHCDDDVDYARKMERYQNDSQHWPLPVPPQE
jgi:hypothetical protein